MRPKPRALLGLGIASLAIASVAIGSGPAGDDGHRLVVMADEARFMLPGLEVRMAGRVVGEVTSADPTRSGRARVVLNIDDAAWPLRRGTTATFRQAGTIAFTNRYVQLDRPAAGAPLPDGAVLERRDVVPAVEFDEITRVFDAGVRRNLRRTFDTGGKALGPIARPLRRALDEAPPVLQQARAVFEDLGGDRQSLETLVRSTDALVHAIDASNPGAEELLAGAGRTFEALAQRTRELQLVLAHAPRTLDAARTGLARTSATLGRADTALQQLAPGVNALQRLARPLRALLGSIVRVAPQATGTLATLQRATRDLDPALDQARTLMPTLGSVAGEAAKQLNCIRPYAPEIAGMASTWTGFLAYGDSKDKFARVNGGIYPHVATNQPTSSAQWVKLFPGLKYAFPRPPGYVAGQPWFNDKCGVGRDSVDPTKDPEAVR